MKRRGVLVHFILFQIFLTLILIQTLSFLLYNWCSIILRKFCCQIIKIWVLIFCKCNFTEKPISAFHFQAIISILRKLSFYLGLNWISIFLKIWWQNQSFRYRKSLLIYHTFMMLFKNIFWCFCFLAVHFINKLRFIKLLNCRCLNLFWRIALKKANCSVSLAVRDFLKIVILFMNIIRDLIPSRKWL